MKHLPYGIKFNLMLCFLISFCIAYALVVTSVILICNALE